MFVKDYIKIWQIIYWSIIWVLFFSHIDKDAPFISPASNSPLYTSSPHVNRPFPPPPQNSSSNLSPSLCFYLCLYLIFYFFTHHTQSKSGRPGALQDKEVSTMSLLCVYAYVYFCIILYHVHFYTYIISIFFFLLFITCFKFGNYLYRMFSNNIWKLCWWIDLINIEGWL